MALKELAGQGPALTNVRPMALKELAGRGPALTYVRPMALMGCVEIMS